MVCRRGYALATIGDVIGNLGSPFLRIPKLVEDYGLTAVVETGVGHAGSLTHVLNLPERMAYFGCDIDPEAIRICKETYVGGIFALEDSRVFLRKILAPGQALDMPTLFFLDAHSFEPGPDGFPLLEELELIATLKPNVDKDVIICDDWRVVADEANPRFWPGELPAQYVRDEHAMGEYTLLFRQTHEVKIILDDQGYLMLLPRTTLAQRVRE